MRKACTAVVAVLLWKRAPKSLDRMPHGRTYRFRPDTPKPKRQCFYDKLGISQGERVLREKQFVANPPNLGNEPKSASAPAAEL